MAGLVSRRSRRSRRTRASRARRRSTRIALALGAVVAVALFLLVGGLAHVPAASRQYHAAFDQSYGRQVALQAEASNRSAALLDQVLSSLGNSPSRVALVTSLSSLAGDTADQAAAVSALGTPIPVPSASPGGISTALARVFADRAAATLEIEQALVGLLGLTVPPGAAAGSGSAGATGTASSSAVVTPTLLSSSVATDRIAAAYGTLADADRSYAALRRVLRTAPGRPQLPTSAWVGALPPPASVVATAAGAPGLQAVHGLCLAAVRILPVPVPNPGLPPAPAVVPCGTTAPPGVDVVPPTSSLDLTAVVENGGNVAETGLSAMVSAQPQGPGTPSGSVLHFSLAPGASLALGFPALRVIPGDTYTVTVAITSPANQAAGGPSPGALSRTYSIKVAPGTQNVPAAG